MTRTIAVLITHTHERIARSVMAMACQTLPPDAIVVSCDAAGEAIDREVERAARRIQRPVTLVTRAATAQARPAQTRNNAVRAVMRTTGLRDDDRLVFLDGDCIAPPSLLATHAQALALTHLSLGWRIELSEAQTAALTDDDAVAGRVLNLADKSQIELIERAARAHRRRMVMRMLSMTKPHKPQVLGANFGVRAWVYRAVNGMDETYTGWGMEDDDFGRRVYALGGLAALRLRECPVLHQHHPTRSRGAWMQNEQAPRIGLPFSTVCRHGLLTPLDQPEPRITTIGPSALPIVEPKPDGSVRTVRAG